MGSIVYLKNKESGKIYVYTNNKVWDETKKSYQYKRKCIGHLDPETGEIVSNRPKKERIGSNVTSIGVNLLLSNISENIRLTESLQITFPDIWNQILTCAIHILSADGSLSGIKDWMQRNDSPSRELITLEKLSRILSRISDDDIDAFMRIWRKRNAGDNVVYISTSAAISSDVMKTNNPLTTKIITPILDVGTFFSENTKLPLSYEIRRKSPISEHDIGEIKRRNSWLNFNSIIFALESGISSDEEYTKTMSMNEKYILRLPNSHPIANVIITEAQDLIMDYHNYETIHGDTKFAKTFVKQINGIRTYIHIFYSADDAEMDMGMFLKLMDRMMDEITTESQINANNEYYNKFFIVNEGIIEPDSNAIMEHNSRSGFVVITSNSIYDLKTAQKYAHMTNIVDNLYSNVWNIKDQLNLKLFMQHNMNSAVFIHFISLILHSEIINILEKNNKMKEYTSKMVIDELSSIYRINTAIQKSPLYSTLTESQSELLKIFDIDNLF